MKKYLKYFIAIILVLISVFMAKASSSSGCNVGNNIYPNATGGLNSNGYPLYYNSNSIPIRWWDEDPNCGIRDNKIRKRSNDNDKCEVLGNNWGVVYTYNPKDNSCSTLALPLDDYTWVILFASGTLGYLMLNKR